MDGMNDAMSHITAGAAVVYALQWLKKAGWCSWVTEHTTGLNRAISALAAALIAFGISATGDANSGWTITIPPLQVLALGVWEWGKQWTAQQLIFDGIVQKGRTPTDATRSSSAGSHESALSQIGV